MKISLMSTQEAAKQLGVTQRTIANAVRGGRLSAHRIGKALAVIEDDKFRSFAPGASRWDRLKEGAEK